MNNAINSEVSKALKPVRKFGGFCFNVLGKATNYAVTLCSLPFHGINYAIFKARNKNTNLKYNYNGSRITKVSNYVGQKLASVPYKMGNAIRR